MNIYKSAEDYLEAILRLGEEKGQVRSVDVAALLKVSKPSVSVAMKRLRENGYLIMDEDNLLHLTDRGLTIARDIYARHQVLTDFLLSIGVPEDIAREDACKMEHDISDETYRALRNQLTKGE